MTENIQLEIVKGVVAVMTAAIAALGAYIGVKRSAENKAKIKLANHPVFTRIEFYKHIVLTSFEYKNKGKEIVFKEILVQHLSIYNNFLEKLCKEIDENDKMDATELLNKGTRALSDITRYLSDFYKDNVNFTPEEKQVLEIVLDKYQMWDSGRETKIMEMIENVCGSAFYPDTYSKAVTIFDLFLFTISDTIEDANKTLSYINGDLKGLKFKGVVI